MAHANWVLLPVLLAAAPLSGQAVQLKRAATIPSGPHSGVLFGGISDADFSLDGYGEVVFNAGITRPSDPLRWEVWESRPVNRWELVFADTGAYPCPPGILTGNLHPWAVGDIDRDSLADIAGFVALRQGDSTLHVVAVVECTLPGLFPTRLAWTSQGFRIPPQFVAYTDLDQDGNREVFAQVNDRSYLWEARGDDSLVPIDQPQEWAPSTYAFGDFDGDGLLEYATGFFDTYVFENVAVGVDSYALVFQGSTGMGNGADVFSGDVDGDGRPEFFIDYEVHGVLRLVMWKAYGNNEYEACSVDYRTVAVPVYQRSTCGDLDGDGVDELVWLNPGEAAVYRYGSGRFELVWRTWLDADYPHRARAVDANRNGYAELLLTEIPQSPSVREIQVFEVEAVRVLAPNGGEELAAGDTCVIRWRTFEPPRCDSLALYLLTDTVVPGDEWFWDLDTIVTGLAPTETSHVWVVPDTVLEAGWVVAIAYGPGWQFDRSDEPFRIVPTGMEERTGDRGLRTGEPIPTLVGDVLYLPPGDPGHGPDRGHAGSCPASLLDPLGRRVMELRPGPNDVSHLAPGVYFITVRPGYVHVSRKVTLTR